MLVESAGVTFFNFLYQKKYPTPIVPPIPTSIPTVADTIIATAKSLDEPSFVSSSFLVVVVVDVVRVEETNELVEEDDDGLFVSVVEINIEEDTSEKVEPAWDDNGIRDVNNDEKASEKVEPICEDSDDIDGDDVCVDAEEPITEFVELTKFELAELLWDVWDADEVNDEILLLCEVLKVLMTVFADEVSGCTLETTPEVVADGLIVNDLKNNRFIFNLDYI